MSVTKEAPYHEVQRRKTDATTRAEANGHKLAVWRFDGKVWGNVCSRDGCDARLTLNPTVNGIATGVTMFLAKCPYRKHYPYPAVR